MSRVGSGETTAHMKPLKFEERLDDGRIETKAKVNDTVFSAEFTELESGGWKMDRIGGESANLNFNRDRGIYGHPEGIRALLEGMSACVDVFEQNKDAKIRDPLPEVEF